MTTRLDRYVEESRSLYSIRFRLNRWYVYRGTAPIVDFDTGAEALAELRRIQGDVVLTVRP
ncbi:MAG: hypothetical protein KGL39_46685 [Patescibacteria group bacterium]|nr:hypothetical protein [Patescibacteria group bacterium]